MTRLLLIRHGETDWNKARRFQGQTDIPLNTTGKSQAVALAARLRHEKIDQITSSDLKRAHLTAQFLATEHDMEIEPDSRLREISFGSWEGLTFDEIKAQFPAATETWIQTGRIAPENGETDEQLSLRLQSFLSEIERDQRRTIAVVSHGGCIVAMLHHLLGLPTEMPRAFRIGNTGVTELILTPNTLFCNYVNRTDHLRSLATKT